jgi:hypothetical protein
MIAIALSLLLAASSPGSVCTAPPSTATYPIRVPIEVVSNHVYVKVCSGERELQFILDTGAGGSFFDMSIARDVGARLGSHFAVRGAGAGAVDGASVTNSGVTVGAARLSVPIAAALDLSALPPREGHRIDGILGHNFIARYVVVIDYVAQELRLFDPSVFEYTGPGTSMPLTFAAGHPVVEASVRLSTGDTIAGRFVVDVGAASALSLTGTFVAANQLRTRVGPLVRRVSGGGVGGMVTTDVGRVAGLRLGGRELRDVVTTFYGDSAGVMSGNADWIGNIGGDVLRRFTVILDYQHRRIVLEANAGSAEAFEADMSGAALMLSSSPSRFIVSDVVRNSPAAEAGLAPGDLVLAVDGVVPDEGTLPDLRQRLNREGESVELTILRGRETKTVRLRTRRLL